jgi:hypothetical protein
MENSLHLWPDIGLGAMRIGQPCSQSLALPAVGGDRDESF